MTASLEDSLLLRDRARYFALAYRMLGSRADAEDVLQEAYLRAGAAAEAATEPQRYLFRTVANLCVDRLRAEQVRRRAYHGPWLPEPLVSTDEPDDVVDLAQSLSIGFLLLLERLSPGERVVFVLREAFEFDFGEISDLLGISAEACRQRHSRARRHLQGERDQRRERPSQAVHRALLERLMAAVAEQRIDAVVNLLSEDALLISDGGGVVSAAIRPVEGPERIARVLVHLAAKAAAEAPLAMRWVSVNGGWGVLLLRDGLIHSAFTVEAREGAVRRIYVIRNPCKLAGVGVPVPNV